jgi:hypothetical protein
VALATTAPEASVTVPVMLLTVWALSSPESMKKQAKTQLRMSPFGWKAGFHAKFAFLESEVKKDIPLPRQSENVCKALKSLQRSDYMSQYQSRRNFCNYFSTYFY